MSSLLDPGLEGGGGGGAHTPDEISPNDILPYKNSIYSTTGGVFSCLKKQCVNLNYGNGYIKHFLRFEFLVWSCTRDYRLIAEQSANEVNCQSNLECLHLGKSFYYNNDQCK